MQDSGRESAGDLGEGSLAELMVDSTPVSGRMSAHNDQLEVRRGLKAIVEQQRLSILSLLNKLFLFLVVPIMLVNLVLEIVGAEVGTWFIVECIALSVALVGSRESGFQLDTRRYLVVSGFLAVAGASIFQFGPLIGTGFVFVGAQLVCTMLLNERQAWMGTGVLMAFVAAVTLSGMGFWPIHSAQGAFQLETMQWVRVFLSSILGIAGIGLIFNRIQRSLTLSFEKEILLRLRERRLVAQREKVLRRAASSQRLESLGRLAGGIAHDFNNSLFVIQCGLESLAEEAKGQESKEILEETSGAIERAANTARQLLSFAKRNVEELGEADPETVLARLAKESSRLVPANIELVMNGSEAPQVALSEAAFEQVVLNLVQNARDALQGESGRIEVLAEADAESGGLALTVSDDGPGMPSEVAEQAFEPFFTTKGDYGAGLGLSTVWGVVHRHGGEVALKTQVGKGTKISVKLPAVSRESQEDGARSSDAEPKSGERVRVLILEDEPPVRSALKRIMKQLGFDVVEVSTVAEARAACLEQRFSLLLSDGVVPDGGVGGFIVEFRKQQKRAPVILCSGYLEEDLALQGVARGQCAYLAKPFSAQDLCRLVDELLPERPRGSGTMPTALLS